MSAGLLAAVSTPRLVTSESRAGGSAGVPPTGFGILPKPLPSGLFLRALNPGYKRAAILRQMFWRDFSAQTLKIQTSPVDC